MRKSTNTNFFNDPSFFLTPKTMLNADGQLVFDVVSCFAEKRDDVVPVKSSYSDGDNLMFPSVSK